MKLQQINNISSLECVYCRRKPSFISLEESFKDQNISFFFYCQKHFNHFQSSQKSSQTFSLILSKNIQNFSIFQIEDFLNQTFKKYSLLE